MALHGEAAHPALARELRPLVIEDPAGFIGGDLGENVGVKIDGIFQEVVGGRAHRVSCFFVKRREDSSGE